MVMIRSLPFFFVKIKSLNEKVKNILLSDNTLKDFRNLEWNYQKSGNYSGLEHAIEYKDENRLILFTGTLYNIFEDDIIIKKLKDKSIDDDTIVKSLNDISGSFCGFVWDFKKNFGYCFTDKSGVNKLFYKIDQDELIISNDLFSDIFKKNCKPSSIALSEFLYSNWTFSNQTILEDIRQVNPGHYIEIQNNRIAEKCYSGYPIRQRLSINDSVHLLKKAHLSFWNRMKHNLDEELSILMSKGKDSRIMVKFAVDGGLTPHLFSFYRKGNELYPFITFLTDFDEDTIASAQIAKSAGISYDLKEIPNKYLLDNMNEIIKLNFGTPLHWEFLAASEILSEKYKYTAIGFNGHLLAGRNEHHDYFMNKIKNKYDYALFKFTEAGYEGNYTSIKNLLKKYGFMELLDINDLKKLWIKQYETINNDDLDIISIEGQIRTRGIGREVGTFNQVRKYTIPIYPYLDNEIINAYYSVPNRFLKWEQAHLKLISEDSRFNFIQTGKLKIDAKKEAKYLNSIGYLRRLYKFKRTSKIERKLSPKEIYSYSKALKNTLKDFNEIPKEFVNELFSVQRNDFGYYQTLSNIITLLRINNFIRNL